MTYICSLRIRDVHLYTHTVCVTMTNVNEMNEFTAPLCPLTGQCQLRHIILDSFEGNLHNKCREYVGLLAICSSLKTHQCGCPDPPFLWKCHSGRERASICRNITMPSHTITPTATTGTGL